MLPPPPPSYFFNNLKNIFYQQFAFSLAACLLLRRSFTKAKESACSSPFLLKDVKYSQRGTGCFIILYIHVQHEKKSLCAVFR